MTSVYMYYIGIPDRAMRTELTRFEMDFGHARQHGIAALLVEIDRFRNDREFVWRNDIVHVEIGRFDDLAGSRTTQIELDHCKITQTR